MKLPSALDLLGVKREDYAKEKVETFDPDKLGPKKIYLSWESPSRIETKQSTRFSRTMIIIGVVIGLLLIIMQEYFLILLIASLIFVSQALKKATPDIIKHEISSHGFSYAGQLYYWHQLRRFFFIKDNLLALDTYDLLPGRLFVVINPKDAEDIIKYLEQHINYLKQAPKTSFEKAYDTLLDKLNLD